MIEAVKVIKPFHFVSGTVDRVEAVLKGAEGFVNSLLTQDHEPPEVVYVQNSFLTEHFHQHTLPDLAKAAQLLNSRLFWLMNLIIV